LRDRRAGVDRERLEHQHGAAPHSAFLDESLGFGDLFERVGAGEAERARSGLGLVAQSREGCCGSDAVVDEDGEPADTPVGVAGESLEGGDGTAVIDQTELVRALRNRFINATAAAMRVAVPEQADPEWPIGSIELAAVIGLLTGLPHITGHPIDHADFERIVDEALLPLLARHSR